MVTGWYYCQKLLDIEPYACSMLYEFIILPQIQAIALIISVSDVANTKKASLSDAMLKDLQERCPNIRELGLLEMNLSAVSAEFLPSKLTHLSITSCFVPPAWFKLMQQKDLMPSLTFLDLSKSSKLSNGDLKDLCSRTGLKTLLIGECYRVSDAGCQAIADNLKSLTELDISYTKCSDVVLHMLCRNLRSLHTLNLSHCSGVTDSGIGSIVSCLTQLKDLRVNSCSISHGMLQAIAKNLKNLTVLEVGETGLSDTTFYEICNNLQQLKHLDLAYCPITDAAAVGLTSLANLQKLRLSHCQELTDIILPTLCAMKSLKFLQVDHTKLSENTVEKLQMELNNGCEIKTSGSTK